MALNGTTLSAAIGASDTALGVASATGITAPNFQTGAGVTFLYVENEMMLVTGISGTQVSVTRGQAGTQAVAHPASTPVVAGLVTDFPSFQPGISAFSIVQSRYAGISAPVASALAITPSGATFHVTGTTATATINLPSGFVEGSITVIADAVWTWTAAGNIAVAGTVTTAGSSVSFQYDAKTGKWYPSRLS